VKSFASFRKSKGKEWKSRVTKSSKEEKKKLEDVVVHLGFMEWNEKDQILKSKRGKRLPLRVSPTASYATLQKQAEEKWKKNSTVIFTMKVKHTIYYFCSFYSSCFFVYVFKQSLKKARI